MRKLLLSILIMPFVLAGCGTITRGTTEDVAIQASPSHAEIQTSFGQRCTGSCIVKVARKDSFSVSASAPGYEAQTIPVTSRISGGGAAGMAGNIVLGGVIGLGVDAVSGAAYDHTPNPVIINLRPLDSQSYHGGPHGTDGYGQGTYYGS